MLDEEAPPTKREGSGSRPEVHRQDHLSVGSMIGRYLTLGVLGEGGMGVVYSAYDPELDRKVAIKLLQAEHDETQSGGQTWLLREAQALARLAHPNVIAVHDVGTLPGNRVFIAMELVPGSTLRDWLRTPRRWREILPILRAAGQGLAAAHAAGLVHRDFKPDNVLVGDDGRVRVLDFGLARAQGDPGVSGDQTPPTEPSSPVFDHLTPPSGPLSDRLTATGFLVGTPAYMAPELYASHPADARSDLFAFGVVLYEALYRESPFDRDDVRKKRATMPKPPTSAKVPAWLERIVLRAISLDPSKRFATMDELLAELALDPTVTRRRLGVGAAVAVACSGVVLGALAIRSDHSDLCGGASDKLVGVWDADARGALEAAFHKIPKPFVDDAVRGTEKALDAYAAGWVAMRTEACQATRVHQDQSEDVLTLRTVCLDKRLVELKTLAGLFGQADAELVSNAAATAQRLSALSDCADVAALRAPDPLPKDPTTRSQIAAAEAKLAEARAQFYASRFKDVLALTDSVAAEVTRLQYRPMEAELHVLVGKTRWLMQQGNAGESELLEAVWAAESGKADAIKIEAWVQLVKIAAAAGHFDVALERWRHASAALARQGDDWRTKVDLLEALAILHARKGTLDDALKAAHDARDLAERNDRSADRSTYATSLLLEASVLGMSGKSREALDSFRKLLPVEEALNGPKGNDVEVTLQNMAETEVALGLADDAVTHARRAVDIEQAIYGADSPEVARVLATLGDALTLKKDRAGALAAFQNAVKIMAAGGQDKDPLYGELLSNVAMALVAAKRAEEALPYLDRALALKTETLGPDHPDTINELVRRCDALREAGRVTEALDACKRGLAAHEKIAGHTDPQLFGTLESLGETLLAAKQPIEASAVLHRALGLASDRPEATHDVEFLAARAAWDAGAHRDAIELAHHARDGYAALGASKQDDLREATAWLTAHETQAAR